MEANPHPEHVKKKVYPTVQLLEVVGTYKCIV